MSLGGGSASAGQASDAGDPAARQRRSAFRVAFAGTPEFARRALSALHEAGFSLPLVWTQPDRPAGRGLQLQPSAVKRFALDRGLSLQQPRSLRLDGRFPDDASAAQAALREARADVMVVAAYGLILPSSVLALPRLGCLNIHASLLPRWRGAAPIQRAIEAGDALSGVTIMQMDEGLDTGDMLLAQPTPIAPDDTAATLHDKLAALGAAAVVQALDALADGRLRATPQPAEGVTYARKIEKAEAAIDWRCPATLIERRVRAFDPFPGASLQWGSETLKLWRAAAVPGDVDAQPGALLDAGPGRALVACGEGALELLELQRPGGRRQAASLVLQSRPLAAGTLLQHGGAEPGVRTGDD